jgi:hypothetical protein
MTHRWTLAAPLTATLIGISVLTTHASESSLGLGSPSFTLEELKQMHHYVEPKTKPVAHDPIVDYCVAQLAGMKLVTPVPSGCNLPPDRSGMLY